MLSRHSRLGAQPALLAVLVTLAAVGVTQVDAHDTPDGLPAYVDWNHGDSFSKRFDDGGLPADRVVPEEGSLPEEGAPHVVKEHGEHFNHWPGELPHEARPKGAKRQISKTLKRKPPPGGFPLDSARG